MEASAWEVHNLGPHALWTDISRAAHEEVPLPELLSGAQLLAASGAPPLGRARAKTVSFPFPSLDVAAAVEAAAKAPPAPAAPRPAGGDVVERALAASREAPLPTAGSRAASGLSKLLRGGDAGDGGTGSGPKLAIIIYCPDAERTPLRVTVQDSASVSQVIVAALKLAAAKAVSGGDGMALDARFLWLLPDDAAASGGITRTNAATSSFASVTAELKGFDARAWELRMNDSGGEADLDFPALERSRPIRNFTVVERGEGSGHAQGGTERVGGEYCLLRVQRSTSQVNAALHAALPADAIAFTSAVTSAFLRVYIFLPYPRGPRPVVVMVPFALRRQRAEEEEARLQSRRASGRAAPSVANPHALIDDEFLSVDAGFAGGGSPARTARDVLTVRDVLLYIIALHRLPALTNSYILRLPLGAAGDGGSRLTGIAPERDELGADVNLATADFESGVEMSRKLYLDTPDGARITVVAPLGQAPEAKAAAAAPSSAAWRGGPRGTDSDNSAYENDDSIEGGGGGRAGGRRDYAAGAARYGVGAVGAYRDTEGPLGYGAVGGDLGSQLSYPAGPASFMAGGQAPVSAEGGEGRVRRSWGLGSSKAAPVAKQASGRDIGSIVYAEEWTLTKVNSRGRRQTRVLGFDKTRVIMKKPDQEKGGEKVRLLTDLLRLEMPEGNPTLFTLVFKPVPAEGGGGSVGATGGVSSGLRALGRSLSGILRQPPTAPKPAALLTDSGVSVAVPTAEDIKVMYDAHSAADREAILLRMFTLLDIVKAGGPWPMRP